MRIINATASCGLIASAHLLKYYLDGWIHLMLAVRSVKVTKLGLFLSFVK